MVDVIEARKPDASRPVRRSATRPAKATAPAEQPTAGNLGSASPEAQATEGAMPKPDSAQGTEAAAQKRAASPRTRKRAKPLVVAQPGENSADTSPAVAVTKQAPETVPAAGERPQRQRRAPRKRAPMVWTKPWPVAAGLFARRKAEPADDEDEDYEGKAAGVALPGEAGTASDRSPAVASSASMQATGVEPEAPTQAAPLPEFPNAVWLMPLWQDETARLAETFLPVELSGQIVMEEMLVRPEDADADPKLDEWLDSQFGRGPVTWPPEFVVYLHWRLLEDVKCLADPGTNISQRLEILRWVFPDDPEADEKPFSFAQCLRVVGLSPLTNATGAGGAAVPYLGKLDVGSVRETLEEALRKRWMVGAFVRWPLWVRELIADNPEFYLKRIVDDPQWLNREIKRIQRERAAASTRDQPCAQASSTRESEGQVALEAADAAGADGNPKSKKGKPKKPLPVQLSLLGT